MLVDDCSTQSDVSVTEMDDKANMDVQTVGMAVQSQVSMDNMPSSVMEPSMPPPGSHESLAKDASLGGFGSSVRPQQPDRPLARAFANGLLPSSLMSESLFPSLAGSERPPPARGDSAALHAAAHQAAFSHHAQAAAAHAAAARQAVQAAHDAKMADTVQATCDTQVVHEAHVAREAQAAQLRSSVAASLQRLPPGISALTSPLSNPASSPVSAIGANNPFNLLPREAKSSPIGSPINGLSPSPSLNNVLSSAPPQLSLPPSRPETTSHQYQHQHQHQYQHQQHAHSGESNRGADTLGGSRGAVIRCHCHRKHWLPLLTQPRPPASPCCARPSG
mmetsp:Transcript_16567/g.33327  ORF Transcript_16567/g.33327 Transcript_16567/m.33327 type:complete len:334 (-) Transcript_16567:254-1255(-)